MYRVKVDRVQYYAAAVLIALFVFFTLRDGVPALRHDWAIPLTHDGWKAFAVTLSSGWDDTGIGSARPYPTLFLLGPLLATIGIAFGSYCAVAAFTAAIATLFTCAGNAFARAAGLNPWFGISIGTILVFNSWTYEKLVAGHLTMLLAAAASAFLAAELQRQAPRIKIIAACAFVAAFQIQFGLLVLVLSASVRPQRQTVAATCSGALLSLLPSIVGLALAHKSLSGIPYTVAWQLANSLPGWDGLLLDGYSQRYTEHSYGIFQAASALLVICSIFGAYAGMVAKQTRWSTVRIVAVAAVLLEYSFGLRGSLAHVYALSLSVRPTLVFRELFDLLGVVLIFYALLASQAALRYRWLQPVMGMSAVLMLVAWFHAPPSHWWVPGAQIPRLRVATAQRNMRFALFPWQQPLIFAGRGSGADPDDFPRVNNVTPINEYSDVYPSNVALAKYAQSGDSRDLAALSVVAIYDRPTFATNGVLLHRAVPLDPAVRSQPRSRAIPGLPEMSIIPVPEERGVPGAIHDSYLFEGGEPALTAQFVRRAEAPLLTTDPRVAWVDASIIFSRYPEIANAFGGAFTTSSTARLHVPSGTTGRGLVLVTGTMSSDKGLVSASTHGWKWVDLRGAAELRCSGRCTVSAWELKQFIPHAPEHSDSQTGLEESVPFKHILPYIVAGRLPRTTGQRLLLYRTRFDPSWVMVGPKPLRHVEVSALFNGYILPPQREGQPFLLIESTSVLQAAAMCVAAIGLAALLALTWRPR